MSHVALTGLTLLGILLVSVAGGAYTHYIDHPAMQRMCVERGMGYLVEFRTGEYCVEIDGTRHRLPPR